MAFGAAVNLLGLKGVSTLALTLLAVAYYAHRASTVGRLAVSTGRVVTHDVKVLAITFGLLMILGVVSADPARAQELGRTAVEGVPHRVNWRVIVDWLRGLV